MSSLLETLKNLKNKIFSLESIQSESNEPQPSTSNQARETSDINDKSERLNKKLDILHKDQSNRVKINVGGKIFEMSSGIIFNTMYPNIFRKEISSSHSIKNLEIFFDGNSKLFKYIYKIFGVFQNSNKNQFSENNKYKLNVSEDTDTDVLKAYIKQIFLFNSDFLKLMKLIEIKGSKDDCMANTQSSSAVEEVPVIPNNNDVNFYYGIRNGGGRGYDY